MFNFYSFTDHVQIENKHVRETTYLGYLNLWGYRIRLKLFVEKVKKV